MIKIIVESGSTKADWMLTKRGKIVTQFRTSGLNPLHHSVITYEKLLSQKISSQGLLFGAEKVIFFGAGITGDFEKEKVEKCFNNLLDIKECVVMSDMDALIKVNYSEEPQLLSILGTGTGTAIVEKGKMLHRYPSLGFLLDEYGCGTCLGKRIISAYLKNSLPKHIEDKIYESTGLHRKKMIRFIYEPKALSTQVEFFASLSSDIHEFRNEEPIKSIIEDSFIDFINRELKTYGEKWNGIPIHVYGSVAYFYKELLYPLLEKAGYTDIKIKKSPLPQLLDIEMSL